VTRVKDADRRALWDGAAVRARVAAMAQEDPRRQRFGSSPHGYRLRPPLAEDTIGLFEQHHDVRLPAYYRSFLKESPTGERDRANWS
jgi:hypothetical protein